MNRLEIIKSKFPEHYEQALKVEDPSGKNKYLVWIAKQLANGHNTSDISQTLKFFHENTVKFKTKDINKYDLKQLEDQVKEFGLSNRKIREQDKSGSEKIYEDDDLTVIRVDDKQAMILYGSGTRWCTTMRDMTYYEDYVIDGNDFYIVIRKRKESLTSSKYAIVRKGFLDFSIYDDEDNVPRLFSNEEQVKLANAVKSIICDKPPKNILRSVIDESLSIQECIIWLKSQTKETTQFVEGRRPELRFIGRKPNEIIKYIENKWDRSRNLKLISQDQITEILDFIKEKKDPLSVEIKIDILRYANADGIKILVNDPSPQVKSKAIELLTPEEAKNYLSNKSIIVLRSAARMVKPDDLIEFSLKCKSTRRKAIANEVISERISPKKAKDFVLNQPKEVIVGLME